MSSDWPMSAPPEVDDRENCARFLRDLGKSERQVWPIAEAALALAILDSPEAAVARYRDELQRLARDVGKHQGAAGGLVARARAMSEVILLKHGYRGDADTYDDLQNANLMRVIDRRKGLPVVLGILFIHAGRAQGWEMAGLGFPGHFLVRLAEGDRQLILDPFHDGRVCGAAELRDLLKAVGGADAELRHEHYAPVSDRDVLLRLQNNLKTRLWRQERHEPAVRVVETMLMLAPEAAELWHEAALLYWQIGNIRASIGALEQVVARAPDDTARHQAAAMLQRLRTQLN
jgi:regulator of sirC expression with transglutaminase-like and TPR domain